MNFRGGAAQRPVGATLPLLVFVGLLASASFPSIRQLALFVQAGVDLSSASSRTDGKDQPRREPKHDSSTPTAVAEETRGHIKGDNPGKHTPLVKQPKTLYSGIEAGNPARWEVIAALTKPDYLLVRLLSTPTNHRAPPA